MKRENSSDLDTSKRPRLDEDEDELLRFQKEAILLQMKEYKRKYLTCSQSILDLNSRIDGLQKENIKLQTAKNNNSLTEKDPKDLEIANLRQKVVDFQEKLDAYSAEIDKLNKKIDRNKLHQLKNPSNSAQNDVGAVDQSLSVQEIAQNSGSFEEIQDLKYQLGLKDEDVFKAEKEISRLSMILKQTQIDYKVLKQSFDRRKDYENELKSMINEGQLKVQNEHLLSQVQLLKQSQREYQQLVKDEEEKKRKVLEVDLKKSNQELTRLRTNRDQLAKTIEGLKMNSQDGELNHLKTLVEARKKKIDFLESELIRLKTCVAGDLGEFGLMKFFDAGIENPYKKLNDDLEIANLKLNQLQETKSDIDTSNVEHIKKLQDVIQRYNDLYGTLSENPNNCASLLEKTSSELAVLKAKLEQKEKSEQRLMQELETLGSAWSTLEQQYTSSTPTLDENKFVIEKQKLEQKILHYQKQNSSFNNTYKAQKSQFEKQLEQIRKLEELEKNHLVQLVFLFLN